MMLDGDLPGLDDAEPQQSPQARYQKAHDEYARAQQSGDLVGMQRALHDISRLGMRLRCT